MKKFFLMAALVLILSGCHLPIDPQDVIEATQIQCAFTPAAPGVIDLINAQNGSVNAAEVAKTICDAVNSVNPLKDQAPKYTKGTELHVAVETPSGPVSIIGTTDK